jgi:hypothetical protein
LGFFDEGRNMTEPVQILFLGMFWLSVWVVALGWITLKDQP